jgi:hypothetical protein
MFFEQIVGLAQAVFFGDSLLIFSVQLEKSVE